MDNLKGRAICFCLSMLLMVKASAQTDTPSNSFATEYLKKYPSLHYSYIDSTQTHDYSGNWDIDGDGRKDSILFIGNGGAHLYFHLRLVLSSEHRLRDYPWLVSDMPWLGDAKELDRVTDGSELFPQLLVADLDWDRLPDIYINFDIHFSKIPAKWKRRGVTMRNVVLHYDKGTMRITNYKDIKGKFVKGSERIWR